MKDEYPKALKKREKLRESGQEMFDISHENYSIPSEDKEFFMNQKDRTKRSMSRPYSSPVSAGTSFLLNNGDGFSSPVSAGTSTNTSFQLDNGDGYQDMEVDLVEEVDVVDVDDLYQEDSDDESETENNSTSNKIDRSVFLNDPIMQRELAETADRYDVSLRATSAIVNVFVEGGGVSHAGVRKLRDRERNTKLQEIIEEISTKKVVCIGADERKDLTLLGQSSFGRVEHCSVVIFCEDGSEYVLGSFTPDGGSAADLAFSFHNYLLTRRINLEHLLALATDGCPKMHGFAHGFHAEFEKIIGRRLQRCFCFFHHLEKIFGHQFQLYGGDTSGPGTLKGFWSDLLQGAVHDRPVVRFQPTRNPDLQDVLESMDPNVIQQQLSNDHKIIVGLAEFVNTGQDKFGVSGKVIGPITGARWVTTEARVLRCYVSCQRPRVALKRLINFLMFVWLPVYLQTKLKTDKKFEAPRLLLKEIQAGKKHLNAKEQEVFIHSININGQMGHGENILLCLLSSSNEEEREVAVGKIREIRAKDLDIGQLRQFHPRDYTLNLNAATLLDLPEEGFKTEPPVTIGLTDNQLELILTQPLNVLLPLTTVAVERAVAETTKASRQVTEDKDLSRDGLIALSKDSRKKRPTK